MPGIRFNILSLIAAFLLLAGPVAGQDIPVLLERSLTASNARELAQAFGDRVDLALDGEKLDYSRKQAQIVLSDFLGKSKFIGYELLHRGEAGGHSDYFVARYVTESAEYRVFVYVRRIGGRDTVKSIKFERQ